MKNTFRGMTFGAVAAAVGILAPRSAHAVVDDYMCVPTLIKDHGDATVVYCKTFYKTTTIRAIALPDNHPRISSFVSMAEAALLSGRPFAANIETTQAANSYYWGCANTDCRPVIGWFGMGSL